MTHTCSKCQLEYTDTRLYCGGCGASVGRPCGKCATIVPTGHTFCGMCGAPQGAQDASVAHEPARETLPGAEQETVDFLAEAERDRARFDLLSPALEQRDIAQIFDAPDAEDNHE